MASLAEYDETMLQFADTLSPTAISFKLGGELSPEQVAARITQLLTTPDWLSAAQQDQLVTMKMRQLIARMEDLPFTARTAEVLGAQLERLGNRLDKRATATEKDLSTLYAFQGTVLLNSIEIAMGHIRGIISAGEVPQSVEDWDVMLETAIRFAQMEMVKHDNTAPDETVTVTVSETLPKNFTSRTIAPPPVPAKNRKKALSA